ncbi:MAG: hypothetical protein J0I16_14400 [Rhizobiales bacterium]|nr:hypothetical protein [Hyphomicrobiales bacterium]
MKTLRYALLMLVLAATSVAAQPSTDKKAPQPAQIDRNGVLMLVRSTILAVHHANLTGNYTVLRDLGAPGFQQANTAARLAEIFADLRAKNFDLTGVAVLEPQLSLLPQIEANGMMRMAGSFPSVPLQVNFELLFAPDAGRWKLFGVALNLGQSGPAPPPPAPVAQKEPAKPAVAAKPTQKPAASHARPSP